MVTRRQGDFVLLWLVCCLASAVYLPVWASGDGFAYTVGQPVFRTGDHLDWLNPDTDDRSWVSMPPFFQNRWWARVKIDFPQAGPEREPLTLGIHALGAYEAYWDGRYLGRNGRPGDSVSDEERGKYYKQFVIPADLVGSGRHILALRASSHHAWINIGYFRIEIGEIGRIHQNQNRKTALFMVVLGFLCICGLLFILNYLHGRSDRATLLFGLLSLLVATLLGLEYSKFLVHYPYPYHLYRLSLISLCTIGIGFLLPVFLMVKLQTPHRFYLAMFLSMVLIVLPLLNVDFDRHCLSIFIFSLAFSFALTLFGVITRKKESAVLLVGVGVCFFPTLFTGSRFTDHYFFLSFLVMVAILTGRMVWDIRRQRVAYEEMLVRSARLKYELLKKNIQPHFLMNSLAAAIAWIEENPVKGIAMLKALSQELEAFFKIGERPFIPLGEELALCKHHVETMRYLLDSPLVFECEGVDPAVLVPPGLFLTLVENALTHGAVDDARVSLRGEKQESAWIFSVENPIHTRASEKPVVDGTGFSYIKTLLEQHYPNRWRLSWRRDNGVWRTELALADEPG